MISHPPAWKGDEITLLSMVSSGGLNILWGFPNLFIEIQCCRIDDRMYKLRPSPSLLSPNAVALKISKYTHTTILRGLPNSIGQRLKLDLLPCQVPFSLLFLNSRRCTFLARYTAFVCRHWLDPLRRESKWAVAFPIYWDGLLPRNDFPSAMILLVFEIPYFLDLCWSHSYILSTLSSIKLVAFGGTVHICW